MDDLGSGGGIQPELDAPDDAATTAEIAELKVIVGERGLNSCAVHRLVMY